LASLLSLEPLDLGFVVPATVGAPFGFFVQHLQQHMIFSLGFYRGQSQRSWAGSVLGTISPQRKEVRAKKAQSLSSKTGKWDL
ncbi:MAG: hypothetical protein M1450_04830, partial [Patescibacteria group bacterium]|nr:hypothetical protein [Patescibacteria group bacterium]